MHEDRSYYRIHFPARLLRQTPTISDYQINLTHTSFSAPQQFNWKSFVIPELKAVRLYTYGFLKREMEGRNHLPCEHFQLLRSHLCYQKKNYICRHLRGSAYKPGHKERQSNFLSCFTACMKKISFLSSWEQHCSVSFNTQKMFTS